MTAYTFLLSFRCREGKHYAHAARDVNGLFPPAAPEWPKNLKPTVKDDFLVDKAVAISKIPLSL
jgi:hypothetical protein